MGGDSPSIQQPTMPTAPSYQSSIQDYINAYPQLMQLQNQYAPQTAAMQQQTQQQLYPQQAQLGENLGKIANQGMNSQVPDWMKAQYQSNVNAQLGQNAGSPLGADYMSRGLLQQQQDWSKYYQNLGLSLNNKTPVYGADTSITSSTNPSSALSYSSNLYGTAANMYNTNMQGYLGSNSFGNPWANIAGSLAGGIGGAAGNFGSMATYGYGTKKGWW